MKWKGSGKSSMESRNSPAFKDVTKEEKKGWDEENIAVTRDS